MSNNNSNLETSLEITNANINKVFVKFTLPNVIGFIAMSSVTLVDGYFVGNFVNGTALAAVNIIMPLVTLIYGIAIMLTIGGAVYIGAYLGENKINQAKSLFSTLVYTISFITLSISIVSYIFSTEVARLLGANKDILPYAIVYLETMAFFFIFQTLEYSFSVLTRTDGNPYLASIAVISGAIINFILDYLFVVKMGMGIHGAALGTGISFLTSTIILLFHFILKKGYLNFTFKLAPQNEVYTAAYNGSSELLSEFSAGLVALTFNWIMVTKLGTAGVEAFTIINYAIWLTNMLSYSIGDSIIPLISINYGALLYARIKTIIQYARVSVIVIGLIMFIIFTIIPEKAVAIFLKPEVNQEAFNVAVEFAKYIKYTFLFMGLNIIMSASFTALQNPLQSIIIALLRGLSLPIGFVILFSYIFGQLGIYIAIPIGEVITLIVAILMWFKSTNINKVMKI